MAEETKGISKEDAVRFSVELDPAGLLKGATEGARANDQFRESMERGLEALADMQKSVGLLRKVGAEASSVKAVKEQMDSLKATMRRSTDEFQKSGGKIFDIVKKQKELKQAAEKATVPVKAEAVALKPIPPLMARMAEATRGASASVSGIGGPLANIVAKGRNVVSIFGGAGKAGIIGAFAATSAAAILITAAILGLTSALAHFAVGALNARRSELLMLEGMTKIPNWFGRAAGKATEIQDAISSVAASVALGRERVVGFAQDLYKAGLRGENLRLALEATSIATSAAGESYGGLVKSWLAGTGMIGGNVKAITSQIKNRFGGVARAQMLDLNVQFAKAKENLKALFTGVQIEGFLEALSKMLALFSETSAVGSALKGTVQLIVQPLINGFTKAQMPMKRFFQGATLASLDFQIAVLTLRNWIRDKLGDRKLSLGIDWLTVSLNAGKLAMYGLIGVGIVAAAIIGAIALPFVVAGTAIAKLGDAVTVVKGRLGEVYSFFSDLWGWFESHSWEQIGTAIGEGLTTGIIKTLAWFSDLPNKIGETLVRIAPIAWDIFTDLASKFFEWSKYVATQIVKGLIVVLTDTSVGDVMFGFGKGMIEAFKKALGIHSPSKVFASLGQFTALGFAQGVDRGAPVVQSSVVDMVSLPASTAASPQQFVSNSSTSTSESRSASVHIDAVHIHSAGSDAKSQVDAFMAELASRLEGIGFTVGA